MKSPIPDLVKKSRQDLSDYLWHFCRENQDPDFTIRAILADKVIRGSVDRDTKKKVVCFTEAPLEQTRRQAPKLRESKFPRFSLFGIGFKKSFVFNKGGLPVIYQPRKYLYSLSDSMKWRHVDLDLSEDKGIDYSWQREWRVEGDFGFAAEYKKAVVVVPVASDFECELYDIHEDGDYEDGEMVSSASMQVYWNFVDLECMQGPIDDSGIEVAMMKENSELYPATEEST